MKQRSSQGRRLRDIRRRIRRWCSSYHPNSLLIGLFDFDGTMSPYVLRPNDARITRGCKRQLELLSQLLDLGCFISGRSAHDVAARVGIPAFRYYGNQGLDYLHDGQIHVVGRSAEFQGAITDALQCARHLLAPFESRAILEEKGITFQIHNRGLDPSDMAQLRKNLTSRIDALGLRILERGHDLEVRPPVETSKANVVTRLITENTSKKKWAHVIYIGDDDHDGAAMKVLAQMPFTHSLRIGIVRPAMQFRLLSRYSNLRLRSVRETCLALEVLVDILKNRS